MSTTSMQRPGRLDLELVKGDDAVVELSFVDELGAPVNMAGRSWQLRLSGPGFAVELDSLVVTTFASSGVLSLPFPDTSTAAIPSGTTWYLRDDTNDRTLLDGEVRAFVAGHAGAGSHTIEQTVTITNDAAAVTVTASAAGVGILLLAAAAPVPAGYVGLIARLPA